MNPDYKKIGEEFVAFYYLCYDTPGRKQELCNLYHESALLTFEGDQKQGRIAITERHMALTSQTKHDITTLDCQPMINGGILVVVVGQIQTEGESNKLGFNQTFLIQPFNNSFYIFNEIFRLVLHNVV